MFLVDGDVFRAAVDLSRAGKDDLDLGIELATGFENGQLSPAVDLEVRLGVSHRIHMARLTREVEQEVLAADQEPQSVFVSNV